MNHALHTSYLDTLGKSFQSIFRGCPFFRDRNLLAGGVVTLARPLFANSDANGTLVLKRFVCVSNRRNVMSTVKVAAV